MDLDVLCASDFWHILRLEPKSNILSWVSPCTRPSQWGGWFLDFGSIPERHIVWCFNLKLVYRPALECVLTVYTYSCVDFVSASSAHLFMPTRFLSNICIPLCRQWTVYSKSLCLRGRRRRKPAVFFSFVPNSVIFFPPHRSHCNCVFT